MESEPMAEILNIGRALGLLVMLAVEAISKIAKSADRQHDRGELLAAYKTRHSWKKSDLTALRSLQLSSPALRRASRLIGTGRPVVKPHRPLIEVIVTKFESARSLLEPDHHPSERRRAIKKWPWFDHYVEAMYRGEQSLARSRGDVGPSLHAEMVIGQALGISASKVHSICGEIRRRRKEDNDSANFPPMRIEEFELWMTDGIVPDL